MNTLPTMHITQIVFSIGNSIPLETLSGNEADRYANVKPHTSVKVEFGPKECDPKTSAGQVLLKDAFHTAQEAAFEALQTFRDEFKALFQ